MNDMSAASVQITYDIQYKFDIPGWIIAASVGGIAIFISPLFISKVELYLFY